MLQEKRYLSKFIFTHLCLIIPILLVCMLMAGIIAERMQKMEDITLSNQLNNIITKIEENRYAYYEESILLSEMRELLPSKMQGNESDTVNGLKTLQMKQYFDNQISKIFLYYGEQYVYAPKGMTSKQNLFNKELGCIDESVTRGLRVLENGEENLIFFIQTGYRWIYDVQIRAQKKCRKNAVCSFFDFF